MWLAPRNNGLSCAPFKFWPTSGPYIVEDKSQLICVVRAVGVEFGVGTRVGQNWVLVNQTIACVKGT